MALLKRAGLKEFHTHTSVKISKVEGLQSVKKSPQRRPLSKKNTTVVYVLISFSNVAD